MDQQLEYDLKENHYSIIKQIVIIALGTIVMTIASQISVPMQPVPLTFQTATAILIGMTCGSRLGSHIIITYLVAGALGMPIFADYHAGIGELISPRGGYMIGFIPAVLLSGHLAYLGYARSVFSSFITACLCDAIIFACGVLWLASYTGLQSAISQGLMPFVSPELIKLFTLSCIVPTLWK